MASLNDIDEKDKIDERDKVEDSIIFDSIRCSVTLEDSLGKD